MQGVDRVIFVDDDEGMRAALQQWLKLADFDVSTFAAPDPALDGIDERFPGVLITDVKMPGCDGLEVLDRALTRDPDVPVILVTGHGDVPMAVEAMQRGAYDFIEKPFVPERLVDAVRRACEKRRLTLDNRRLRNALDSRGIESRLLGTSRCMETLRRDVLELAATPINVVIYGETGSGKELVARSIHDFSARAGARFVAVNCGAIPDTMYESELFGHEAGAFTSAVKRRVGKLEYAHRGTLFLDEVESMPMQGQVKMLRALQERALERLGSNEVISADARVISASKADLKTLADQGKFRMDFFFRLSVAEVHIPPLRERPEDIPLLFDYFSTEAAMSHGRPPRPVSEAFARHLTARPWPGNVRELRNAAERHAFGLGDRADGGSDAEAKPAPLAAQVDAFEKRTIEAALARCQGDTLRVMEMLSTPRRTLNEKIQKLGIDRGKLLGTKG